MSNLEGWGWASVSPSPNHQQSALWFHSFSQLHHFDPNQEDHCLMTWLNFVMFGGIEDPKVHVTRQQEAIIQESECCQNVLQLAQAYQLSFVIHRGVQSCLFSFKHLCNNFSLDTITKSSWVCPPYLNCSMGFSISIFYCLSIIGLWRQQFQQRNLDILWDPEALPGQKTYVIPPATSGSSLGPPVNGTCPENL